MGTVSQRRGAGGATGQHALGLSLKKLAPDLKRLNPLEKLRNLPRQNFAAFLQALVFLPLLSGAVWAMAATKSGRLCRLRRDQACGRLSQSWPIPS